MGNFHRVSGDLFGVVASTACRIVKNVYIAIAQRKNLFIKFPQGADLANTKLELYRMVKLPGVICAIDGYTYLLSTLADTIQQDLYTEPKF